MLEKLDLWDLRDERIHVRFEQDVIERFLNYCVESVGSVRKTAKLIGGDVLITHFNDYRLNRSSISFKMIRNLLGMLPENIRNSFKSELAESLLEIKLEGSLSKPIKSVNFPISVSNDMVEFLGHLLGDGCVSLEENLPMIYYTNKSNELLDRFSVIVTNIFGNVNLNKRTHKNGVKDIRCPAIVGIILSEFLPNGIKSLDFIGNLNVNQKAIFLRALFDDEGCVTVQKYQIIIEMANKPLIEAIKSMLLEFGIGSGKISEVIDDRKSSYKRRYRLGISGKENFELFREKINFVNPDKSKRLETLLNSYKFK